MGDKTLTVAPVPESAVLESGWLVFVLDSVGGNIKRKTGTNERTTWATLRVPEGMELRVAVPYIPGGLGPQPEGVVTLMALQDAAQKVLEHLESAVIIVEDNLKAKEKEEGEW
jgi:hypothetical protein